MKTPHGLYLITFALSAFVMVASAEQPTAPRAGGDTPSHPGKQERRTFVHKETSKSEMEKVTFLGVETAPVGAALTAQLGLLKGAGLLVLHVAPESPAASVLQTHDILWKLDDQLLIEPRQFAVLVRNHKPGDEVMLTYVRAGRQDTAKIKLGEHEQHKEGLGFWGDPDDSFNFMIQRPDSGPRFGGENSRRVLSLLDRNGPAVGENGIEVHRTGEPIFRAQTVSPGNSNIVFSDEQGSLELTIKDGRKTLVAKDPKGSSLFSGPIDTPEQRETLPDVVRERLESVEGMQDFSFEPDAAFEGNVKYFRRGGPKISMPLPPRMIPFDRELPPPTI